MGLRPLSIFYSFTAGIALRRLRSVPTLKGIQLYEFAIVVPKLIVYPYFVIDYLFRFCMDTTPRQKKEKLQVNMNLKDIFSKKKSGLGCA